jgi:hypothetical protein
MRNYIKPHRFLSQDTTFHDFDGGAQFIEREVIRTIYEFKYIPWIGNEVMKFLQSTTHFLSMRLKRRKNSNCMNDDECCELYSNHINRTDLF